MYNDSLDPDMQRSAEEAIADSLSNEFGIEEEYAADAARDILFAVLRVFRPDLFV